MTTTEVTSTTATASRINLNNPRYDQSTFEGRAKHFFITTNPLNCLATEQELLEAKRIVDEYRNGKDLNELGINEDKLWEMKQLYDSAFHPQTGEMLILPGRMSFQVIYLFILSSYFSIRFLEI